MVFEYNNTFIRKYFSYEMGKNILTLDDVFGKDEISNQSRGSWRFLGNCLNTTSVSDINYALHCEGPKLNLIPEGFFSLKDSDSYIIYAKEKSDGKRYCVKIFEDSKGRVASETKVDAGFVGVIERFSRGEVWESREACCDVYSKAVQREAFNVKCFNNIPPQEVSNRLGKHLEYIASGVTVLRTNFSALITTAYATGADIILDFDHVGDFYSGKLLKILDN